MEKLKKNPIPKEFKEAINVTLHDLASNFNIVWMSINEVITEWADLEDEEIFSYLKNALYFSEQAMARTKMIAKRVDQEDIQIFKLNSFSINELIIEALSELKQKAEKANINIEYKNEIDGDENVIVDKDRIIMALKNFINNSIDYNLSGGIVIISVTDNLQNIIISIVDNGIGYHSDPESKPIIKIGIKKGFGIGIESSKSIIYSHSGDLKINSPLERINFPDIEIDSNRQGTEVLIKLTKQATPFWTFKEPIPKHL